MDMTDEERRLAEKRLAELAESLDKRGVFKRAKATYLKARKRQISD